MSPNQKLKAHIWSFRNRNGHVPTSVMGNQTGKRSWLQGTPANTARNTARAAWGSKLFTLNGVITTPFAADGFRVVEKPTLASLGEAPQVNADLADMGLVAAGRTVRVAFANADCLGIIVTAGGHDNDAVDLGVDTSIPRLYSSTLDEVTIGTPVDRIVIGGHVGDAQVDKVGDVLASYLSQKEKNSLSSDNGATNATIPASRIHEVYILRGRELVKKWPDGTEENAADRLARLLRERFPLAQVFICGKYTESHPLAFPTSRTRGATKSFLDAHNIAPELGDNLLERLKKMPPALTPEYHKTTDGVDFGDRHALVLELTV